MAGRFARVLGAGDVPSRKPDPGGLLRLMAEAEAAPGETWMVGDSATDVAVARAAGVRVAGVTWGFHPVGAPGGRAGPPDRPAARPRLPPGRLRAGGPVPVLRFAVPPLDAHGPPSHLG